MNINVGNVYTFKMNSGEEIVGKITYINLHHYVVEAPLGTGMTQTGVQLMPGLMTTAMDSSVNIYLSSIAMMGEPREDLIDAYRESITGIRVPEKKILLS